MKGLILAAGRGARMRHLSAEQPKCLTEVDGRALLDWQILALTNAGVEQIGIVTGYRRALLTTRGLHEFHNERWAETNMVSSLACADAWLREGPCIVSYSDIFYRAEPVQALMRSDAQLAVTYDPDWQHLWAARFENPLDDAETFRRGPDGTLLEIGRRPTSFEEVEGQYMGLLRFMPNGWAEVDRLRATLTKDARDRAHMTGMLQLVIEAQRVPVHTIAVNGPWGEIDTAEDLAVYRRRSPGLADSQ
ncbi:MAG: NTP transferase domain-containing protein [Vicinamibacterales bacterium]